MNPTWRRAIVSGLTLGVLAGITAYGFVVWNLAERNPVLCNPGYAGTVPFLLSVPAFWLIAAATGYFASDGRSVWPALAAGFVVGILAAIGNLATMPIVYDQLVRIFQCPTDANTFGPTFADQWSTTLISTVIGSAIGVVLGPGAAALGYVLKRQTATGQRSPAA